nr:putative 12-oxophytodienoate reductase-like protein 2A [Tanacetum cinerariifolium]
RTLAAGATLLLGGKKIEGPGNFYEPTVLANVQPGMAAFDEETFGPVAAITVANNAEHAIVLTNTSDYGLGGSLRADDAGVQPDYVADYYAQRASTGLIVTEATNISAQARGYTRTPGIWTEAQIAAWKRVTEAVHRQDGKIFLQLWHTGRMSHPDMHNGDLPVAPSAIKPHGQIRAVIDVWGADRVGIRISPVTTTPGETPLDSNTMATFGAYVAALSDLGLLYIHEIEGTFGLQGFGSEDAVDQRDALTGARGTYQQGLVAVARALNHFAIAHAEGIHPHLPIIALSVLQQWINQAILRAFDRALLGEQVRAADGDQVRGPQAGGVIVRTAGHFPLNGDIHMPVLEVREPVADLDRDFDGGAALFEVTQRGDQPGACDGRRCANGQPGLPRLFKRCTRPGFFDDVEGVGQFVEQAAAAGRELNALGVALEQALADLVFQALDLLADGGRGNTQMVCCTFHTADLAHLDEGAKGNQRDRSAHCAYSAHMSLPVSQRVNAWRQASPALIAPAWACSC